MEVNPAGNPVRRWCARKLLILARMLYGGRKRVRRRDEIYASILQECSRLMEEKKLFQDKCLSLKMLALEAGTNRQYLSGALSGEGGFNAYVNKWRLGYAEFLIASDGDCRTSLSEVAERSGFHSERSMNRYMMKSRGVTASELRNRIVSEARSRSGDAPCQAKNFSTSFIASGSANTATRS